jgi:peptidoglycan LD-endopeptidase LytH
MTAVWRFRAGRQGPDVDNLELNKPPVDGGLKQVLSPLPSPEAIATPPVPSVTPSVNPNQTPVDPISKDATTAPQVPDANLTGSYVGKLKLIIPVLGVKPEQLLDTFADSRSEGRVHDAIDIPAAAGTPVLAATDGEIVKLFQSERGGTTIYQLSPDKKLIFYYAHLQRYADGLAPGKFVKQGEVISYVGDTGNAGVGNYHLHFSVMVVADPKRYWEGTNINPYPLLKN